MKGEPWRVRTSSLLSRVTALSVYSSQYLSFTATLSPSLLQFIPFFFYYQNSVTGEVRFLKMSSRAFLLLKSVGNILNQVNRHGSPHLSSHTSSGNTTPFYKHFYASFLSMVLSVWCWVVRPASRSSRGTIAADCGPAKGATWPLLPPHPIYALHHSVRRHCSLWIHLGQSSP